MYGDLPAPPGYVLEETMNTGLFWGGVVTFGAFYATSIGYGAAEGFEQGLGWVALPLFGPWIAMGGRNFDCDIRASAEAAEECQRKTIDEAATLAVLAGLGIGQTLGAALAFVGVFDRDAIWVRSDLQGRSVAFDFLRSPHGNGFEFRGTF